ncbi:hypothetical protein [Luteimonas sp. R10]|uniref:hypothetical protein n=1 Tax=Luteimonas sp. R10 TaxID=3108176 RepID=UPI00388DC05F
MAKAADQGDGFEQYRRPTPRLFLSRARTIMPRLRMPGLLAGILVLSSAHAADAEQSSLYAVNAAALASGITYCGTRYGGLQRGSAGAECFTSARSVLADFDLRRRSQEVAARCSDPATFNTCLTPEIARLVHALNAEFADKGL